MTKPFVPFAPGRTKSRRVEGDETVLETELDKPIDYPVLLAGNYHLSEETRDGLTIRVASYAMDRPTAFKRLANVAFGIVKYYETFLGPFPLPELNIIVASGYYHYTDSPIQFMNRGPGLLFDESPDPLGREFARDIASGIADTGVKAAFLKCAVEHPDPTPGVERVCRAVQESLSFRAEVRVVAPGSLPRTKAAARSR